MLGEIMFYHSFISNIILTLGFIYLKVYTVLEVTNVFSGPNCIVSENDSFVSIGNI